MKVTVNNTDTNTSKPFPKLMKSKQTDAIVFFRTYSKGIVIVPASGDNYSSNESGWLMSNFEDFNGSITLSND